jgi:hypothetical protein
VSFLAPSPFSAARTDEASSRRKGFETSPLWKQSQAAARLVLDVAVG